MRLSVTVITKNEAGNIARCLASVPFADEIVVVDCGSADDTVAIAKKYTERVVHQDWLGHVKQKQHAVDIAQNDWILSLDADEEVSPALRKNIEEWKKSEPACDAYRVNRKVYYLGRWIEHSGWYPDKRIRLFDRRKAHWGGYDPHDEVICSGTVGDLNADIHHYSYRNLSHHLQVIDNYTTIMAERYWEKGRRAAVTDLIFRPPFAFFKKYFLQAGFLDGVHGLIVCGLTAYYVFCKYIKLWEKGRKGA